MKIENIKSQMRKGVLEMCVLSIIEEKESYSTEIIQKLKNFELIVVEGTLYPLLNRLKNGDLLEYHWVESSTGPPRKYYKLTESGKNFLSELKSTWSQLESAVSQTSNVNK